MRSHHTATREKPPPQSLQLEKSPSSSEDTTQPNNKSIKKKKKKWLLGSGGARVALETCYMLWAAWGGQCHLGSSWEITLDAFILFYFTTLCEEHIFLLGDIFIWQSCDCEEFTSEK